MDSFIVAERRYEWTPWIRLEPSFLEPQLITKPGLYRIRRADYAGIDYIGQTGVGIRARVRMLRGITNAEMPYRDPHTAAPALWAMLQSTQCAFEVSCLPVAGDAVWRKSLEAVAIALYRQQMGRSPTVNFGRMPSGYRMSSGNNARLAAAGKRFRGGMATEPDANHVPGVPPAGRLEGNLQSANWCGHQWSGWRALSERVTANGQGLYRIRGQHDAGLVYIGEGGINKRLGSHQRKGRASQAAPSAQEFVFAGPTEPEYSYVIGGWEAHQRRELENDLIAAHVLRLGRPPPAQFIG